MFLLSLLSLTVFVVPIFVTFGAYFAIEHSKILGCGFHCGVPGGTGTSGTPGAWSPTDLEYCEQSIGITPYPGGYVFNPNQWGATADTGSLCIKFTDDNPAKNFATGWAATWNFTIPGPETHPVHAFPNALLDMPNPVQLSSVIGMTLDIAWSYSMGSATSLTTDYAELTAGNLNANVCVDMFISHDEADAASTTASDYEVMVWFASIGPAAQPLGFEDGVVDTRIINGVTFNLYSAANQFGQTTFTWLAAANTNEFNGNIGPLVHDLGTYQGPEPTDYIGYIAFGSETFNANQNATFYNPRLEIDIITS